MNEKRRILLVTGLSGAGLSTTLNTLEDKGWKAVDNLPLSLVTPLLEQKEGWDKNVAIGIDSRTWDFTAEKFLHQAAALKTQDSFSTEVVFIDCHKDILQQRYTETRRQHPLAVDRPVADGIITEKKRLKDIKKTADHIIDTTELNVHELRRLVTGLFAGNEANHLLITLMSFGFKNGMPRSADMVFDVRFLDNPHWNPDLRPLTGLDSRVSGVVKKDPGYAEFFDNLTRLLVPLLPRYHHEGKSYLTIAFGCTGGKHRSVTITEDLVTWLKKENYNVTVRHRDLPAMSPVEQERKTG